MNEVSVPHYDMARFRDSKSINRVIIGNMHNTWSLVVGDTIQFQAFDKPSSLWWRLWQWLLLGWKWESNEEADEARERRWQQLYNGERKGE